MNLLSKHFDFFSLNVFISVAEERSLARAAERNHIALSAVSKRISDLEDSLKVTLLRRHSKGVDLTASGHALLRHARGLQRGLYAMESELMAHAKGARGHIRIYANISAISEFLPQDLADFSKVHPHVKFDLQERISPAIVRAVLDNETDIGIFGGNIAAAGLELHAYRTDHLCVALPPGHRLEKALGLKFSDLVEEDWVGMREGSSIDSLCVAEASRLNVPFHPKVRVAGLDAVLRMVQAALGISIIPKEMASDVLQTGRVQLIELKDSWAVRTLQIGVRDMEKLTEGSRLLVEHLIASSKREAKH
jgi:DNA-binding transcriptional LysR family regulator